MSLLAQIIVSVVGLVGLIVTTIGGVYVATRTNSSEKVSSAQKALEATRDEAHDALIELKDAQIEDLKRKLNDCEIDKKLDREDLEDQIDKLNLQLTALRTEHDS